MFNETTHEYNYMALATVFLKVAELGGPIDSIGVQPSLFASGQSRYDTLIVYTEYGDAVYLHHGYRQPLAEDIITGLFQRDLLRRGVSVQLHSWSDGMNEVFGVSSSIRDRNGIFHEVAYSTRENLLAAMTNVWLDTMDSLEDYGGFSTE